MVSRVWTIYHKKFAPLHNLCVVGFNFKLRSKTQAQIKVVEYIKDFVPRISNIAK